jgi:hypothetical protein
MNDFLPPDGLIAAVPPLTSLNKKGKPKQRRPHVETQLGRLRALPAAELLPCVPEMLPECVVHFIQNPKENGEVLTGALHREAHKRARRIAFRRVWRHPENKREQILTEIDTRLLNLLLGKSSDTNLDFYEIAFEAGISAMTKNALRSHKRSPMGAKRVSNETQEVDADGEPFADILAALPDSGASPEEIAIRRRMIESASRFVKTRREWKALDLYYMQDLPMRSVVQKMKRTEHDVWDLLKSGIQAIRRAFGVDPREGGAQ